MNILNSNNNITGINELINNTENINLEKIEKEILDGTNILDTKSNIDPSEEYKKELNKLMNNANNKVEKNNNYEIEDKNKYIQENSLIYKENNNTNKYYNNFNYKNKENYNEEDNISKKEDSDNEEVLPYKRKQYYSTDKNMIKLTNEEKRQDHISNVIHNLGDMKYDDFNIEKEQEEDDKIILLEQIDMLKQILEDDGIDISRVPEVYTDSNIKDIKNVAKILKIKNDRNRLSSLAEEGILLIAAGLEFMFDGRKDYFGYRPDLIGWSETVKIKLRRLKFETSTIVSNVVKKRNMTPGTRLVLELIPSMFLYNRSRKQLNKEDVDDKIVSDEKYKRAISELNNIN